MKQKYAVYKGENLLCSGTAEDCAEILNVSPRNNIVLSISKLSEKSEECSE